AGASFREGAAMSTLFDDLLPPPLQMLRIMMGPWVAQVAAAIARFEVPDRLAEGPRTAAELAERAGAEPGAFARLLRAAASAGMLREVSPGLYAATPLGDTLRRDVPGSVRDLVVAELGPGHWLPWGRLHEAVRTGHSQARAAGDRHLGVLRRESGGGGQLRARHEQPVGDGRRRDRAGLRFFGQHADRRRGRQRRGDAGGR